MKSVLVTGGAGYIGSHTCKALSNAGYRPVVLDNLSLGHREFVKWGPLVEADISDADAVARTIKDYDCQAVVHFAAFAYVGESVSDPAKYYENNVVGTLGLLRGMRHAGCENLVFSSTCAVYGEPSKIPIDESTPTQPVNPYGRSKLVCEGVLADFKAAYGLNYIALRYFNASGDDADGEVGEHRELETHLIPRAMMAIQGYIDDFQVFGSDFPTPDGTAVRDYIHVEDLAFAHVLALENVLAGPVPSNIYNLGVGSGYSVKEVLDAVANVSGYNLPTPTGDRRPGDPAQLIADANKARLELGFIPTRSDLTTIVDSAWRWHQKTHPRQSQASKN